MNCVQLTGRFTRDPDIKYTDNGYTIARFTIACDRIYGKKDGSPSADFPSCVAFGKTAEFIEKYFHKGMKAEITGRIQTGSYKNNDGKTVYTTDVVVEHCDFAESKKSSGDGGFDADQADAGFMDIPDGMDDEVPFN